jgi:glucose-1-phosphate thymidylyltransferase
MIDALILAAGYGTRLQNEADELKPVLKEKVIDKPKALIPMGNSETPIITHIVRSLERANQIGNIYVVTNQLYHSQFLEWQKGLQSTLEIKLINDGSNNNSERLGAIGDIGFVLERENIDNPLLIVGSDNMYDFELDRMLNYFQAHNKDVVSVVHQDDPEILRQRGVVKVDENNRLTSFEEKPESPQSTLHTNCLYIYTPKTLGLVKTYLEQNKEQEARDAPGKFLQWLYQQREVYGFVNNGNIADIGRSATLLEARKTFAKQ